MTLSAAVIGYGGWQDTSMTFGQSRREDVLYESPLAVESLSSKLLEALAASDVGVEPSTLYQAMRFALALPVEWPRPEIVVEDNGDIAFDWWFAPRKVMSIAVGPDGTAGYASLVGHEPSYGRVVLGSRLPEVVTFLMPRLKEHRA